MSQIKFAQQLRRLRKARGLTQSQLAGAGLSVSYVSLLEAGKRTPTPETVQILAEALDCEVADLMEPGAGQPLALVLAQADLALEAGQVTNALERYEQALAAGRDSPELTRRARLGQAQSLQRALPLEAAEGLRAASASGRLTRRTRRRCRSTSAGAAACMSWGSWPGPPRSARRRWRSSTRPRLVSPSCRSG